MAKKVKFEFESANFREVDQNFDNLTKKEQEVIVKGSKLGKTLEQAGNKAGKGAKKGTDAFAGLRNQVLAAVSAQALLQKGIDLVNREYEKQIELQGKAAGKQEVFAAAVGNFRNNNQEAIQRDPQLLRDIQAFALAEGAKGGGTPSEVLQAITDVRSKAGEGFTIEQQLSAVQKAVQGKILDPTAELADIATANLRVQKSLKVSEREAQNTLIAFGPTAGGDVNAFVKEFGTLVGAVEAQRTIERRQFGQAQTRLSDVLALEGIVSQKLGISPEETTTIVTSALAKVGGARIGQQQIDFRATNAVDRLIELGDRVLRGEFGTGAERQQVLTTAGLRGSQALAFLSSITDSPELRQARASIARAADPGVDIQAESLRQRTRLERAEAERRAVQGRLEVAQVGDIRRGDIQRTREAVKAVAEIEGVAGPLGRGVRGLVRDVKVTTGISTREEAVIEEREAARGAFRIGEFALPGEDLPFLLRAFGAATDGILQALRENKEAQNRTEDTGGQNAGR